MVIDNERYEICLQCLRETCGEAKRIPNRSLNLDSIISEVEDDIVPKIKRAIRDNIKWKNFGAGNSNDEKKLCRWCCYVLEHVVLEGKALEVCSRYE